MPILNDQNINQQQIEKALKQPFPASEIKWRVGATYGDENNKKGIALAFIDARHVMNRLDEVVGQNYWQSRLIPTPGGFICEMGLDVTRNGNWVWKANSADDTQVEAIKGAASDAFKRAGVLWGIGRYLYDLPNVWVPIKKKGNSWVIPEGGEPELPSWALPEIETDNSVVGQSVVDDQEPVAVGGLVSLEAIHTLLDEVEKLDEKQKESFREFLKASGYSFGKKVDDELQGWNIRYKDLEPIMRAVSEIAEPF